MGLADEAGIGVHVREYREAQLVEVVSQIAKGSTGPRYFHAHAHAHAGGCKVEVIDEAFTASRHHGCIQDQLGMADLVPGIVQVQSRSPGVHPGLDEADLNIADFYPRE